MAGRCSDRIILDHNVNRIPNPKSVCDNVAAKLVIDDWIERVYIRRRRRSAIGMNSLGPRSEIDSLGQHNPPDPVPTKQGQAPQVSATAEEGGIGIPLG